MPTPLSVERRRELLLEVMASDAPTITPAVAAPIMGCTAYLINLTVNDDIELYGEIRSYPFRVERRGRRVLISRPEFVRHYAREFGLEQPEPTAQISAADIEAIAQRTAELLLEKMAARAAG